MFVKKWMIRLVLVLLVSVSVNVEVAPQAIAAQLQADVILSSPPIYNGVNKAWPGDEDKDPTHAATTRNGTACWTTSQNPLNPYLYVDVGSSAKPAGATYAIVSVDYFDAAETTMEFNVTDPSGNVINIANYPDLHINGF